MNVLILTGRFGMGHYSAAHSIKEEIIKQGDNINVEVIDIVDYMLPKLNTIIYSSFDILVKRANRIYNYFYNHTMDSNYNTSIPLVNKFVLKIENLISKTKPDIVISTLPLCSRIMSEYKRKHNNSIPLVTCITDVSIHNEWISPHTNLYMVATKRVKANLIKNGVEPKDIIIAGIPVKTQFKDRQGKRARYYKKEKTLLVMGGGLGIIPLEKDFYYKLSKITNLKVIVITGNNKKEYAKLSNKYDNIKVIGYTNKVHEYMASADLIITKAGGITTFESIYSNLPLIILSPFLEQERNNAYFIEQNYIGEIAWDKSADIASKVLSLISDDEKLITMQDNMDRIISDINDISFLDIMERFNKAV